MATNKHATIRYHALDRCFSNHGRKFFLEDLIVACNEAICDFSGIEEGVKRRQIFDDITFMESEQGWSVPLARIREGKRVYYRYSDRSFSIKNLGINQTEAEQLKQTLTILSRFKGLPQFDWIEEIQIRLADTFKLKGGGGNPAVSFEENPYLKGLNHFAELFNAIQNREVLTIGYKGFKEQSESLFTFHPWFLKQYNNRWFLFGFNEKYQTLSNLAVDRIRRVNACLETYKPNEELNFEEFFEDVVGVTVKYNEKPEKIILKISPELWPYIDSKPIHGSQKKKAIDDYGVIIELTLQVNHELVATLFSYLDGIEVLEPLHLRERFRNIAETVFKKYF